MNNPELSTERSNYYNFILTYNLALTDVKKGTTKSEIAYQIRNKFEVANIEFKGKCNSLNFVIEVLDELIENSENFEENYKEKQLELEFELEKLIEKFFS